MTCPSYVRGRRTALRLGIGEQIGEIYVRDVKLRRGGAERWMRDFEHSKVLLNMTAHSWNVRIGPGYRYLRGTQEPEANTGKPAPVIIEVPPYDARFLSTH